MELIIAKERYSKLQKLTQKICYQKWIHYIDQNKDYYEWLEETEKGKNRLLNIDKYPEDFREGLLEQLNKGQAVAEFNSKKDYHEMVIDFNPEYGFIRITLMKRRNKRILKKLLEMANYLDALLLKDGTEIIDEKVIESLT